MDGSCPLGNEWAQSERVRGSYQEILLGRYHSHCFLEGVQNYAHTAGTRLGCTIPAGCAMGTPSDRIALMNGHALPSWAVISFTTLSGYRVEKTVRASVTKEEASIRLL